MAGEAMLRNSTRQIRAWNHGYRLAARHAGWRPGWLLAVALLVGILSVGAGLGFLWASADLFSRWATGETVSKKIIGKFESWNREYGAPRESRR